MPRKARPGTATAPSAKLAALGHTHPRIKIQLLENLSLALCRKLRKANREIALLV